MSQPDFFVSETPPPTPTDAQKLRGFLKFQKTWCTRADICSCLGWTERQVRAAAEQLGPEIVRCQAGFKLTMDITRDDTALALQGAQAAVSQGKRQIRYGLAVLKRLHSIIG